MWSLYSIAISPSRSLFDGCGRMNKIPIAKFQISRKCTSYSSARTEALLKSSSEIILWHLNVQLKVSVDMENNTSVRFHWMKKKTSSLIEDKRKNKAQRAYTHWNSKRHIPLVSFVIVA